jgi:dephospho-CoA kinase
MLRIGLTGGIASGKSTVAEMLRERDCQILDADVLSHELLEPGQETYHTVVREFGRQILAPNETIDRQKLGAIVFAEPARRERLNQIMHPRIQQIVAQWFDALERTGDLAFAFEDAALIIESGAAKNFDHVVVCWCRPEQQVERLVERGLSQEDARLRIASQMPIDEKRQQADFVIDCSETMNETRRQVDGLIARLKDLAAGGGNISQP